MRKSVTLVLVVLLVMVAIGCSKRVTYRIPPRVDLTQHEMIGVIEFNSSEKGELAPLATRRFTEAARAEQGLVRMVGFGPQKDALDSVGKKQLNPDAYKALGTEHGVKTILVGEITISDIKPAVQISGGFDSGSLSAKVDATLAVELIEASTGASIWSSSARATHSVGHLSVFKGGGFVFDAEDPDDAYGGLVDSLVAHVTRDFRVTYERR
jgi:hypothetical protein